VRLIALSLFVLHAKFCAYWCRHDKVTASDKVGRFFETQCIPLSYRFFFNLVISCQALEKRRRDVSPSFLHQMTCFAGTDFLGGSQH